MESQTEEFSLPSLIIILYLASVASYQRKLDKEKIILGIDPGTTIMGFGVIRILNNKIELIQFGDVPFRAKDDHYLRLKAIHTSIHEIIDKFKPDELSIEAPFFGKNVQSMLKLGRAQGICMAVALSKDIPVFEYSPKSIKRAITGNGNASKEQVAGMLASIFKIKQLPKNLDATDGLAAALCQHFANSSATSSIPNKKSSSWGSFIKENPKKIK